MKRKALSRALIGAPVGLLIGTIITICISLTVGDGNYYPVAPQLITDFKNELNAYIIQSLLCIIYGSVCAASSVIWETEKWSPLRQTLTHFIILTASTFPIAYYMHWMEHSLSGILSYITIFFISYLIIWITMFAAAKKQLTKLNKAVENKTE
ncbi:MAG: DUF3021 domain-containing protein [Ruminococcaceae bacterium]|nr:DUF3021 domain-containing protein [Oscillospiraceae bacterium]